MESGKLEITSEYEDIHSFVEANLIDRIGDAGKKLHTGRSRNDQVALDMKLYVSDEITEIDALVKEVLVTLKKSWKRTFTPICRDSPICRKHSRSHWHIIWAHILKCSAATEAALQTSTKRMNYCPLGSGALAGTTYPLDALTQQSCWDLPALR